MAQMRFGELLRDIEAERYGEKIPPKDISLQELIAKYEVFCLANKKPNTIARELVILRNMEKRVPISRGSQLTAEILEKYKVIRRQEGIGPNTLNKEITLIRATAKVGRTWGYLIPDLSSVKRLKVPRRIPHFFSLDELELLLERATPLLRCSIMLCYYGALRRGEALALRWEDVYFDKKILRITPREEWTPKDLDERVVPLHQDLAEFLCSWRKVSGENKWVLPWPRPAGALSSAFTRLRRECGIEMGSTHSLRRSFVSHCVAKGKDLFSIGKVLGHSSTEITRLYAGIVPGTLEGVVDALPSIIKEEKDHGK
ncbi:tyrosine-type recombinase/integrase [Elusimicrobiota bacterium]